MKSNSTDIDLSVDLGEFDINTFSEEVRKLHEEGKLKKFLKQALGMRQSKISLFPLLMFSGRKIFVTTNYLQFLLIVLKTLMQVHLLKLAVRAIMINELKVN